eukprot:jgi/Tetstr1/446812/TSEL_034292.t1
MGPASCVSDLRRQPGHMVQGRLDGADQLRAWSAEATEGLGASLTPVGAVGADQPRDALGEKIARQHDRFAMFGSGSPTGPKMVDAGKAAAVEGGMPPKSLRRPGLFPFALDCVLEHLLSNSRLQPAADEYYNAACYGVLIAGSAIELWKLLAAACCVTNGIMPAFGQRVEAVVHSVEAIDDGHRFRLAYLRKHWHTFVVRVGEGREAVSIFAPQSSVP